MWESMGVVWEWTWYSQTVHAYTEPDLVGANAGTVSLPFHQCSTFFIFLCLCIKLVLAVCPVSYQDC